MLVVLLYDIAGDEFAGVEEDLDRSGGEAGDLDDVAEVHRSVVDLDEAVAVERLEPDAGGRDLGLGNGDVVAEEPDGAHVEDLGEARRDLLGGDVLAL